MFPFAGITDKDSLPFGPEAEKWMEIDETTVFVSKLILTQDQVFARKMFLTPTNSPLWVGSWCDNLYIYNGHHRAIKAALRGDLIISARVCII